MVTPKEFSTLKGSHIGVTRGRPVAQTFTSLLFHVVFSTKDRLDLIPAELEPKLYAYFGGIVENQGGRLLAAGGTANHVHLLISHSKSLALVDTMEGLKKNSSKWIKTQDARLIRFHWQAGYAAFSIGQSSVGALKRYLAKQKEHHRTRSFQEELVAILKKYDLPYDERYIWS
jgi:putative transposase